MRMCFCVIALVIFCTTSVAGAAVSEYYFTFKITDRGDLSKITRVVSIDNVDDLTVYAYANDNQLRAFERLGYSYELLPHPGTLIVPRMAAAKSGIEQWDSYPTYDAYVSMMYQFAADYPDLCAIVDAGSTVDGRSILFAHISDNVSIEEDEPEVMYTSSMHGNETTGYVLMLRLIDSLLAGYGTDTLITRLVDSCEIWINPLANPDGTYASGNHTVYGATRGNVYGVDLNRNFPDPDAGPHPDGNSWQQETVVMMDFADAHTFVISANHHGGAEVVNYPWDTWSRLHVDNDWYVDVCRQYADSAQHYSPSGYLTDQNNGITNGYAWYEVEGGRQDYMNYWRGCREITIELSHTKLLDPANLPDYWEYNRVSFLNWFENALYGVRGVVTDAATGDPVAATVRIVDHDSDLDSSRVFTDPNVGDYHRMIEPGIYDLEFSAPGYYLKTVKGVAVSDQQATRVDVTMNPLPNDPDIEFVSHDAGTVDPGDTVNINITLVNNGAGTTTGASGEMATADPYITVTQATAAFPTIAALGGTGTSLTPFGFSVSPDCPRYHPVPFDVFITADGGYSDTVSFELTVGRIVEDFESGDFTFLPWQMGGWQSWSVSSIDIYQGSFSAKSGAITHNQYSELSVTLDISDTGAVSFAYRVSSEINYDYLRFLVDGIEKGKWSGERSWATASYAVSAGTHTFTWRYTKDLSFSEGSDCAWVDYVIFPPIAISALEIVSTLDDWTAGYPYSYQLEAAGGLGTLTWSDMYGDLVGTGLSLSASGTLSGTVSAPDVISFTAAVADQIGGSDEKQLGFTVNPALTITTDSLPTGNVHEPYLQQLQSTGGTGAVTWTDIGGVLDTTELTLSPSGMLSGTVTQEMTIVFMAEASDEIGARVDRQFDVAFVRSYLCGNANGDGEINIGDAVYIVNYIFKAGPSPDPLVAADVNADGNVNIGDAVYLIDYIFKNGPEPNCP